MFATWRTVISESDLQEIYLFGTKSANAHPYAVVFEAEGHYNVTEDAIDYIAHNPHTMFVIAKTYVINTKEAEQKTRLHPIFDRPELKPFTFPTVEAARKWLLEMIQKHD